MNKPPLWIFPVSLIYSYVINGTLAVALGEVTVIKHSPFLPGKEAVLTAPAINPEPAHNNMRFMVSGEGSGLLTVGRN